jgi:hypothetical protein
MYSYCSDQSNKTIKPFHVVDDAGPLPGAGKALSVVSR